MANRNLKGDVNVQFEEPTSRINLDSGSSVKTLFGRISKWLKDLKAVAFSGSYTDLSDKPTIPPATAVKGNAETTYRTGNVNLTPADIGLGNVNNTSDANKPISTATQAALDSQQAQIDYNTNNGVKNLLSTEWFVTDPNAPQSATVESYDVETGSITGFASASLTNPYLTININVGKMNNVLENGKTYILSWTVDSMETSTGILGMRRADNNSYSVGGAAYITRTGNYSVSYTHNSSIPVFFSLCINTTGLSTDKRIAISNLMLKEAAIEDSTFEPYAEPNYQLTRKVDKALEQTGYNLLEITEDTQTINGVTFIVNREAGTITANGTATAQAEFVINYGVGLPLNYEKELWSFGSPSGSAINTYFLNYKDNKGKEANCYTNGPILPVNTTYPTKITRASICIRSGVTVSDLVFKPMIVPAELAGVPFQPYAKSNAELTSGKLDVTGNAGTPYDQLPDRFELWTTGPLNYDTSLFIKMISMPSSKDRFLLLGNDDNMLYFGIEKDNFVVQTKDANSYYEFKDDGIYLNGTRIAP